MKYKKTQITRSITLLSIVPLLLLGLVLAIITSYIILYSLTKEVENGLGVLVRSSYNAYELKYPGDYETRNEEIYKGGRLLKEEFSFVDDIKKISGADATVFFGDKRYLTTILGNDGKRVVGTKAMDIVAHEVIRNNKEYFSSDVLIEGVSYFGYYKPLRNSSGNTIGMLFAGKPRDEAMQKINMNIAFIVTLIMGMVACTVIISNMYSRKIIVSLKETKRFLKEIAEGNLNAKISPELLARQDEIGEMGRFAEKLKESISDLVGKDPLTGLYNRRTARITFNHLEREYKKTGSAYVIAMGDIDFFKQINDNHGHLAGDEVLKLVSRHMQEHMKSYGFVFRWGGEEFLLIYQGMNKNRVREKLAELAGMILSSEIILHDNKVPLAVTMTFGIADYCETQKIHDLLALADSRLYQGKNKGRNCIVTGEEADKTDDSMR